MLKTFLPLLLFFFILPNSCWAEDVVLVGNEREDYITTLLKHVLTYTPEENYQLTFYNADVPKIRALRLIAENQGIDVIAAGSTRDRERMLLPIRIPIYKGLFGWRIPLVKKDQQDLFKNVQSNDEFKALVAGQLFSWSDTKILEANQIHVEKGSDYEGLFQMLEKGRFDYFPRSVIEVGWEFENHKHMQIAIDPFVLIHYPTAYYFYVSKSSKTLAANIKKGLEEAMADGSFERIFLQYHGDELSYIQSQNRRVISLKNPLLPARTPLHRRELWLDLSPSLAQAN